MPRGREPKFDTFVTIPYLGDRPIPVNTTAVLEAHTCTCGQPDCDTDRVAILCPCGQTELEIVYFKSKGVAALICQACHSIVGSLPIDPLYGRRAH
jgi:hypothetical protein